MLFNRGEGSNTQRYSEAFTYDKQGNPRTLQRYGLKDNNTYGLIDNLLMNAYIGNQLCEVQDLAGDQSASDVMEFKDGIQNPGEEYIYNSNGGLTSDYNKKICMIKYNYLTLPQSVQFRNGNRVEYVYDAAGVKHRTRHKVTNRDMGYGAWSQSEPAESDFIAAQTVTTDYVSNKVYKNGQLSMLLTEEGYIEKSGSTYTHHYYLKDHIGNHRIVMNSAGTVVQATNYYPSGTTMADYPRATTQGVQPYKFGGKELDRKDNLNFYDYEARAYDPTLMRFTSTDPMMEKYYGWSPFAYCLNNPVKYVDPDGKKVVLSGTHEFMLTTFYDLQRLSSNDLILLKNGTLMEFAKYNAKRDGGVLFIGMPEEGKTKTFGTSMMTDLIASKHTVSIKETTSFNKFEANSNDSRIEGKGSGGTIIYAPKDKGNNIKNVDGTYRRNPFIGLGHELIHASHAFKGIIKSMKENYKWDPDSVDGKPAQMSIEEYNTRMEENKIRQENNEKLRYLPQ